MPYWYGFRVIKPSPPGSWVVFGPYESRDDALRAYDKTKLDRDGQVSPPFSAEDKAEAERKVEAFNPQRP
jgi:hypothetical protein